MRFTGAVELRVNGAVRARGRNTVVTVGLEWVILRLATAPPAVISHMAFGDSGAAVLMTQTALQGTEPFARKAVTTAIAGAAITYSVSFTHAGATATIREVGLFNALTLGTMLARFLPQEFTIFAGDLVEVAWTLEAA